MQKNHPESPLFSVRENAEPSQAHDLGIFDELDAISKEIERCRLLAQN